MRFSGCKDNAFHAIYHVMLRGINRQDIFDDTEDYWTFIKMMSAVPCYIYAYCLMPNHVHLLIAEKSLKVSEVVKCIASCYVPYYNRHAILSLPSKDTVLMN